MKLKQLREKRAKAVEEARKINDLAARENRDLTAEENDRYKRHMDEARAVKVQIDREEELLAEERDLDRRVERRAGREDRSVRGDGTQDPEAPEGEDPEADPEGDPGGNAGRSAEDRRAVLAMIRGAFGEGAEAREQSAAVFTGPRSKPAYRKAFRSWIGGRSLTGELRSALQVTDDEKGGYVVPPEQWVGELIRDLDKLIVIRRLARKFVVAQAKSLGVPRLAQKASTWTWGSELSAPTEDSSLKFGKRSLHPHPATGEIPVSRDLMRQATIGPEQLVREEITRDKGEMEEQAFLLGSGANQPLGLFTASVDGIPTSRDVSTANTSTALTLDGLRNAKYSLKQGYRGRAAWLFHDDAVLMLSKIKDGNGQYVWSDNRALAGEPDRLLNLPIFTGDFVPNTFTASQYVGMVADFSWYWIADALDMEIQRLDEIGARNNQVIFIARAKTDGAPMKAEAFTRIKLAA